MESDKIVPYLHPDEQLIQLGSLDTCCELFILSITTMCIENLHLLLPEYLNKCSIVRFSYRVLENDVELKPFKTESGKSYFVPEKVVVRIRSSLSVLKQYLQLKPYLLICLKHENNVIAESSVNLQPLISADNLQGFLKCTADASTSLHERCFINKTKQDSTEKFIESQHQKSYLDLQLKLQYIGSRTNILFNFNAAVNSNNCVSSTRMNYYEESINNVDQVE